MNIILIGMRGSGKTTVAKQLAKKLNKEYKEMDELIVVKKSMSIPEIVEKHGWDYFRDLESEIVQELCQQDNIIISCGGGVVVRPKNITILKKNGKLFWLQVSVETLLKRIGDDANRPSLTGKASRKEDMEEVLQQRYELYKNAADVIIDTEKMNAKEVADTIIKNSKTQKTNSK